MVGRRSRTNQKNMREKKALLDWGTRRTTETTPHGETETGQTTLRPQGGKGDPKNQPRSGREGCLSPIQRKRRKTTRKYVFSGKFAGQNGGKRRVYRDKALNQVMNDGVSAFVDVSGRSIMPKRVAYQGKYPEWWSKVHGERESKKIHAT